MFRVESKAGMQGEIHPQKPNAIPHGWMTLALTGDAGSWVDTMGLGPHCTMASFMPKNLQEKHLILIS